MPTYHLTHRQRTRSAGVHSTLSNVLRFTHDWRRCVTRYLCIHLLPVPLVELLHAIFHRALVRTDFVVAALEQRFASSIHAQRDLIIFNAGLQIRRAMGFDKLALE